MAIFYKHIKGCGSNSVGSTASNNSTDLGTWIEWTNTTKTSLTLSSEFLPKIYGAKTADATTSRQDFGYIITSRATGQSISTPFTFSSTLTTNDGINTAEIIFKHSSNNTDNYILAEEGSDEKITLMFNVSGGYQFNNTATFKKDINCQGNMSVIGDISTDSKCQASYFNATSDQRAKENITPASFSALSAVNSLPVYTFNYKTKPEELTIGLIAQEAAVYDLDNFNMVDNLDASGENNDFMQMKESKLVYVLGKAVQELSAEVESLKQQLASK